MKFIIVVEEWNIRDDEPIIVDVFATDVDMSITAWQKELNAYRVSVHPYAEGKISINVVSRINITRI